MKQASVYIGMVLLAFCVLPGCDNGGSTVVVSGAVVDQDGPVAGALVKIQGTGYKALTDKRGKFRLSGFAYRGSLTVTAWKQDYYCTLAKAVTPLEDSVRLTLTPYQTTDNPDYEWLSPLTGENSCVSCHEDIVTIWENNAHAGSAVNPRFLTLYYGTDRQGNQSPLTRYTYIKEYGTIPLPPDPDLPYYGPGYKLDFPQSDGNCGACHIPGAAVDSGYEVSPRDIDGADTFGIHCDFCHKVAAVELDPASDLPHLHRPGVMSMDVRRPFTGDPDRPQLFFGTFDDVNAPKGDAYLPLLEESRFCAPCHYGVFWDTVVYNSYGEWLDSDYSDPVNGRTCQQCHMPSPSMINGRMITNIAPGKGGVDREPDTIHAHLQLGAMDEDFMQNAVSMDTCGSLDGQSVKVTVHIANDNTGHHVPTDSPLRHLILLVDARNEAGERLEQTEGETLPDWCGVGDEEDGCYANFPGKAFAKILEDKWTGESPTAAYWNHTRLVLDNRIAAGAADTSTYGFFNPSYGDITVRVKLIYRRAYKDLMEIKGWDVPDVIMADRMLTTRDMYNRCPEIPGVDNAHR